jgi:signal transduction histidine kinase
MARRLRRGQAEREALLRRSIDASEVERRRIARDLHDGAVQNLAGVSYSLSAAVEAITRGDTDSAIETVRSAAGDTRHSIRELRTLLVDIYPPNLRRAGLAAALSDLVASLPPNGLRIQLDVQPELRLPDHAEPLLYRVAQEALRNVVAHAEARHVRVAAGRRDGRAFLSVEDDGRGFATVADDGGDRRRHFGLRILHDLASDARGKLSVDSKPGAGTRVRIEVPV